MAIYQYMEEKHKECDEFFSASENAVDQGDWSAAESHWQDFYRALTFHLSIEEDILFPQFEAITGVTHGPTEMMRMEHVQMRALCDKLSQAIQSQDKQGFLGHADTLMILMQQHNMKEEQVLYPMADRVIGESDQLVQRMQKSETSKT